MKVKHIIDILDNSPLSSLSPEQLALVREHSQSCVMCGDAYRAAKLSSIVMRERAQTVIEPSPFFQTKVMAAWRERQAAENLPVFARLWKSAGALVSSMAVTTAALAALSFVVPASVNSGLEETASGYSAESVLLDQTGDDQMSYEQVLSAIYENGDEGN